jgi:hypothetical protein
VTDDACWHACLTGAPADRLVGLIAGKEPAIGSAQAPPERPDDAEIRIDGAVSNAEQAAEAIVAELRRQDFLLR